MPDPAERFIAAAVRPLEDNAELDIAARNELAAVISESDDAGGDSLETAALRLEQAGNGRRWPVWRIALYAVTVLVSVASLEVARRDISVARSLSDVLSPIRMGIVLDPDELLSRQINAEQRFLLFGDTTKTLKSERMKALWDAEPENPAYFAEYSILFRGDHDRLPPDFQKTAERLDPDNAWFTLMAASAAADGAVEKHRVSYKDYKAGVLASYSVLDASLYRETLDLMRRAASQHGFDSYQSHLVAERVAYLPKRTDFLSQVLPTGYIAGLPAGTIRFRVIEDVVDAELAALGADGNEEAVRELARDWESCLKVWAEDDKGSLIDALVLKTCIDLHAKRMEEISLRLRMPRESERWGPVAEAARREEERQTNRTGKDLPRRKGGILAALMLPVLQQLSTNAPAITAEDLKPGRLVDHELFSRVYSSFVWLAFGLMAAAAAFYRMRASVLVRRLSQALEPLLRPADWLWILGGGILLPFAYYLVIYRLTPFGARDWSIAASGFMVPSGQFGAAGFLMIVMPVLIARWRLGLRGAALGFQNRRAWLGWIGVVCGALAIPAFGMTFMMGAASESATIAAAVLLGILQLAWLVTGLRAVFGRKRQLLRRVTITRALVPAYLFGMLLMVASMPVYHVLEKHWVAQDRLMEITPDAPAMSRYEWEVTQAMRQELRELLE